MIYLYVYIFIFMQVVWQWVFTFKCNFLKNVGYKSVGYFVIIRPPRVKLNFFLTLLNMYDHHFADLQQNNSK